MARRRNAGAVSRGSRPGITKPVTPEERAEIAEVDIAPTEDDRRMELVFRLIARGYSQQLITRITRTELGIGPAATLTLIGRVKDRLRTEAEGNRPFSKGEQIARVRDTIEKLKTPRFKTVKVKGPDGKPREQQVELPLPAQNIMRAEELLADLEGNRAPVKVEHTVALKASAMAMFSNLTPEGFDVLLARGRERRRLALLASNVVEHPQE